MTRILAAIDDSETAPAVLAMATALATATAATAEALHVREDGHEPKPAEVGQQGVTIRDVSGNVVEQIAAAAGAPDVGAVVVGARRRPDSARPTGHVTLALLTSVTTPLIVVPPTSGDTRALRRMLVPLDGTTESAERAQVAIALAAEAGIEAIVVYVCDEDRVPMFTDQPQHETEAFAEEFIERFAPDTEAGLELRVGTPAEEILATAATRDVDLIAIVWGQRLESGRADVVKDLLAHSPVPLFFLPVEPVRGSESPSPGDAE